MARKNVLEHQLLKAQSLSADFISPVTTVSYTDNVSYQINVTTTDSTGSFAVEVSNDYAAGPLEAPGSPGNWLPLNIGGTPVVAGADTIIDISLNQLPYKAIRLHYTHSVAGTGVCDAFIVTKQIGG